MTKSPPAPVERTDAEWRRSLTPRQYAILRRHATEPPGSSPLLHEERAGTFRCAGCGRPLFDSRAKYDSGSGWPSFRAVLPDVVATSIDRRLPVSRVEVHCASCGGHLGHVFDDGPLPGGQRWCINGEALRFVPDDENTL